MFKTDAKFQSRIDKLGNIVFRDVEGKTHYVVQPPLLLRLLHLAEKMGWVEFRKMADDHTGEQVLLVIGLFAGMQ